MGGLRILLGNLFFAIGFTSIGFGFCLDVSAQTVRYVHTDALGSVSALTDSSRNIIERREYEPYGASLGAAIDGVGYAGHVMDAATGLTYMQQRYYDPTIGRFLSVDPVTANSGTGANFNRYWYANNNPYRFTDPDGRLPMGDPNTSSYLKADDVAPLMGWIADGLEAADEVFTALPPQIGGLEHAAAAPLIRGARALVVEAKAAAALARANKIGHIFGQARHNLGGLVNTFGGEAKAFKALEKATVKAVDASKSGKFETVVKVGGQNVTVRGAVVDGQVKVGTAFIPPPPPPPPPPPVPKI
ncbi:RHS repeat-associated core domain-containing protein [Xanthomonas arboricola]|uniref:RHS repeat-associated core domain-containing protein n=1 Tax=Xanthomonas arboricola TaxID=56448 RepID=UPI000F8F61FE|nr:RHS repeat-associated core domain-containing protein [Xanthomonas arboricola]